MTYSAPLTVCASLSEGATPAAAGVHNCLSAAPPPRSGGHCPVGQRQQRGSVNTQVPELRLVMDNQTQGFTTTHKPVPEHSSQSTVSLRIEPEAALFLLQDGRHRRMDGGLHGRAGDHLLHAFSWCAIHFWSGPGLVALTYSALYSITPSGTVFGPKLTRAQHRSPMQDDRRDHAREQLRA